MTNTQTVVDAPHKDLRRARAASLSLIPTTTGSATAIGMIFPELEGRLNGLAVRVPLLNASLTDCVFEVERPTTVEEVNGLLGGRRRAVLSTGILGYEERPLVSVDYRDDPRSGIVDARLDDGHRRDPGEGARLVRQRVGLREPAGRARPDGRASASRARPRRPWARPRQRAAPAGRPAQLRPGHRARIGPTRSPTARSGCWCSSTSTTSATARSRSRRCSSSTSSSGSSPTSSAAGWRRAWA